MPVATRFVSEIAALTGLAPLAWLVLRAARGRDTATDFWWIAVAFSVSWLADGAARVINPWLASITYPVVQVAIIALVFCSRRDAARMIALLVVAGCIAVARAGAFAGPDVLLHTVAFLGACAVVWNAWTKDALRRVVLVNFGLGWVAWIGLALYPVVPRWPTWLAYQACRLAAVALFCVAASRVERRLEVIRGMPRSLRRVA